MDEVSSHVRLDPAVTVRSWQRLFRLVLESHDGRAPGADSEEKHEPVSDIDTVAVDSLKALDPKRPIREADMLCPPTVRRFVPIADSCTAAKTCSFDHLVGKREQLCWNFEAECLRCLHID